MFSDAMRENKQRDHAPRWRWIVVVVATFRAARLTLQTGTLWLVGWCRERPSHVSPLTCPNVNYLENRKKKMKRNASKKKKEQKRQYQKKKTVCCLIQTAHPQHSCLISSFFHFFHFHHFLYLRSLHLIFSFFFACVSFSFYFFLFFACVSFSFYVFLSLFCWHKKIKHIKKNKHQKRLKKQKISKRLEKSKKKKKRASKGGTPRDGSTNCFFGVEKYYKKSCGN